MIATRAGGSEGVGFALPVNAVVRVYNDIIRDGKVTRGSIGIQFQPDTKPETLRAFGVDHGVIVDEVFEGSPADKAGMKAEDIITSVNGQPVLNESDFRNRIADLPVGTAATLTVDREGKKLDLRVTIGDRKVVLAKRGGSVEDEVQPEVGAKQPETKDVKFGINLRAMSDQEREAVPDKHGITVSRVESDSFAEEIGMQAGDVILAINRQPVSSLDDVKKVQQRLKPGDPVAFKIARPQLGARVRGPAETQYLSGNLPQH
jgi:serine protease Do